MISLSGCTTKYVDATALPKPKLPSKQTLAWVEKNNAPDIVIEDLANCVATNEIIKETKQIDDPIEENFTGYLKAIWDWGYNLVAGIINWIKS